MKYLLQPWQHQLEIIEKAKDRNHYAIFAEVGTGKSGMLVNILRHKFYEQKKVLRTIILCPPIVRNNWLSEFKLHSKVSDRVVVLKGPGKKRLATFEKYAFGDAFGPLYDMKNDCIFVTNYESLSMKELFHAFKKWQPECLALDESHRCKSFQAKRTKLAIELADLCRYKYLLTGTPILNTPMDIWSQFRILDGGETFDKNFWAFKARYFYDKNSGMPAQKYFPDWRPRPGIADTFNSLIYAKSSRVLKKDCLDLPPLVRETRSINLEDDQKRMYEEMKKNFVAYLDDKACVATLALTKALRLQQITSGFWRDDAGKDFEFTKNNRLDALMEVLDEIVPSGHKVIIWACFAKNYEQIMKRIGDKYKACLLVGGMSDKEREGSLDTFAKDGEILVANQQAGGIGINLTMSSYSIYYSRNFSLEADLQSEARNYRGGSEIHEKVTRIDLLAPGTIDEIIHDALSRKENLANSILKLKDRL